MFSVAHYNVFPAVHENTDALDAVGVRAARVYQDEGGGRDIDSDTDMGRSIRPTGSISGISREWTATWDARTRSCSVMAPDIGSMSGKSREDDWSVREDDWSVCSSPVAPHDT